MNKTPSVSVLIPTYNSERTVERALKSVFAQTLRPLEVIIVDDGSTDETLSIVKTLSDGQERGFIKLIELQSNRGCYYARNAGWDAASGQLLAFLDSDDSWHPRKLEIQANYMLAHDEFALTAHQCTCPAKDTVPPTVPHDWKVVQITGWQLMISYQFLTPSVMLRRDIPYRFDASKRYCSDRLLYVQLTLNGLKAGRIELPLAYLYKAPYGESGLSSHLWETEKSELDNFSKLRQTGLLTPFQELLLKGYSLAKYLRRVCISWTR